MVDIRILVVHDSSVVQGRSTYMILVAELNLEISCYFTAVFDGGEKAENATGLQRINCNFWCWGDVSRASTANDEWNEFKDTMKKKKRGICTAYRRADGVILLGW